MSFQSHLSGKQSWNRDLAKLEGPGLKKKKLAANKFSTLYFLGPNFGKARELFGRLNRAQKSVEYTRLE